jgi:hypothetical protein
MYAEAAAGCATTAEAGVIAGSVKTNEIDEGNYYSRFPGYRFGTGRRLGGTSKSTRRRLTQIVT